MADIILHHYGLSPYAEKVRRILGFKELAWKSVQIPIVAPKPDLIALTGGYRKTPVMQVGADIYCDTDCIARAIERIKPTPTLFPPGGKVLGQMLDPWQNELFMSAVLIAGASGNIFPEGFVEDRATMFEAGFDLEKLLALLPARRDHLRAKLDLIERQLGDGRRFMLGEQASLADFAFFHPLFALQNLPATKPLLDPYERLMAWMRRIDAFGHGNMTEIEASEAIEIARAATPATATTADGGDPNDRKPGDRVEVEHIDFGKDPVVGELVASSPHEISIRRHDDRAGDVIVHFPRDHYVVRSA